MFRLYGPQHGLCRRQYESPAVPNGGPVPRLQGLLPPPWSCSCGAQNSGKFCTECGKPGPTAGFCSCGFHEPGQILHRVRQPKSPTGNPVPLRQVRLGLEDQKHPQFCPNAATPLTAATSGNHIWFTSISSINHTGAGALPSRAYVYSSGTYSPAFQILVTQSPGRVRQKATP